MQACTFAIAPSKGPGHFQYMFTDIAQYQVGRDGSDLVQARFPEFPLDVVFLGECEAAMGLH